MHKMISTSLKMVKVVILSKNSYHFVSYSACNNSHEISHVLSGTTYKNQHRNRGPIDKFVLTVESRDLSQADKI